MCCRSLFAAVRRIGGRSRRSEQKLDRLLTLYDRLEIAMTATKNELLAKIEEAQAAADAERKEHAQDIETAVATAKAAWEADNKDEHDAAMARLDALIGSLKNPSPIFSPSAN